MGSASSVRKKRPSDAKAKLGRTRPVCDLYLAGKCGGGAAAQRAGNALESPQTCEEICTNEFRTFFRTTCRQATNRRPIEKLVDGLSSGIAHTRLCWGSPDRAKDVHDRQCHPAGAAARLWWLAHNKTLASAAVRRIQDLLSEELGLNISFSYYDYYQPEGLRAGVGYLYREGTPRSTSTSSKCACRPTKALLERP